MIVSKRLFLAGLTVLIVSLLLPTFYVHAQYSGTTYQIEEAQVGAVGSDNDLQGTDYMGRATAGDIAIGDTESAFYAAIAGFTTTGDPHLEVTVNATTININSLSSSSPSTATATFWVRSYLADGYNVFTVGQPPTNENSNQITPMAGGGASSVGTSQFGINLIANTSPSTFGADPIQVPDASFSYGQPDTNYGTPNSFRYNDNERIAYSSSSTGQTTYTISYLYNIGPLQQAGLYVFTQSIVVVATY